MVGANRKIQGHLLREFKTSDGDPVFLYEKHLNFSCQSAGLDHNALLFPRQGTRLQVACGGRDLPVSERKAVWIPKGQSFGITCETAVCDALWILLGAKSTADATNANKLGNEAEVMLEKPIKIELSAWVVAVRERLIFEQVINLNPPEMCTLYLEKQLINGVFQLAFDTVQGRPLGEAVGDIDPAVERALRFVEQNLFEPIKVSDIAAYAHLPVRTLNRGFQAAVGEAPMTFLRRRRLEECRMLFERGEHQIADLATLAGYSEPAAFTRAFTQHFGAAPSNFKVR